MHQRYASWVLGSIAWELPPNSDHQREQHEVPEDSQLKNDIDEIQSTVCRTINLGLLCLRFDYRLTVPSNQTEKRRLMKSDGKIVSWKTAKKKGFEYGNANYCGPEPHHILSPTVSSADLRNPTC